MSKIMDSHWEVFSNSYQQWQQSELKHGRLQLRFLIYIICNYGPYRKPVTCPQGDVPRQARKINCFNYNFYAERQLCYTPVTSLRDDIPRRPYLQTGRTVYVASRHILSETKETPLKINENLAVRRFWTYLLLQFCFKIHNLVTISTRPWEPNTSVCYKSF